MAHNGDILRNDVVVTWDKRGGGEGEKNECITELFGVVFV